MMRSIVSASVVATLLIGAPWLLAPRAVAGACEASGSEALDAFQLHMICGEDRHTTDGETEQASSTVEYLNYTWASVCAQFDGSRDPTTAGSLDCAAARQCTNPDERLWQLWGERVSPESGWALLGAQCFGAADPPAGVAPTVTAGMVLEAIRQIGLPALEAKTQPAGKTLVNFETIFYAEPQTFTRSLTLLGQQVEVEARPVEYRWHHGDGTVDTTTSPGAPYPAKDITYSYSNAHVTVETRVDVTYEARFRVNSGSWQAIAETVTITGPANALRVAEAVPVLSGDYS